MYFIGQTGGPDETPPVVVSALRETGTTTDTIVALPDPASAGTPYSDIGAPQALVPYMQLLEKPPLLWSWGCGWHASSIDARSLSCGGGDHETGWASYCRVRALCMACRGWGYWCRGRRSRAEGRHSRCDGMLRLRVKSP